MQTYYGSGPKSGRSQNQGSSQTQPEVPFLDFNISEIACELVEETKMYKMGTFV